VETKPAFASVVVFVLSLTLLPTALASTTWYVNGVTGSDSNSCLSPTAACKTIGHAISLASSGDSIMLAAATYKENLTISISLKVIGSGATTTIIDGGGVGTAVTIPSITPNVVLSELTIENGSAQYGGGINNSGTLTVNKSTISGNYASMSCYGCSPSAWGGGIYNGGTLTINDSTISGNLATASVHHCDPIGGGCSSYAYGGGILNDGAATINNSTISGNGLLAGVADGGGIYNDGTATINNSTVANTSSGHSHSANGVGIYNDSGSITLQNTIVATNSGTSGVTATAP